MHGSFPRRNEEKAGAGRSLDFARSGPARVRAGDLVRTGQNFHPHYKVIATTDDRAWIRDVQHGRDFVVPLERCSRIG